MRNFELPGRSIAVGRRGMAATSHPAATLAAVDVLRAGGNAIDAAITACAVQGVVEAGSTGIGGDCFALFSRGCSTDVIAFNGSGRTPMAATPQWYELNGVVAIERHSPHAVTIPGAVEAWSRLIADHGRLPLATALAPAIALARDGYAITPRVNHDIMSQRDLLRRDPTARRIFLEDGEPPSVGAVQRQPELAATLEAIGHEGPDAFYRGPIAAEMVAYLRSFGGLHTLDDFARARGEYVAPISAEFRRKNDLRMSAERPRRRRPDDPQNPVALRGQARSPRRRQPSHRGRGDAPRLRRARRVACRSGKERSSRRLSPVRSARR